MNCYPCDREKIERAAVALCHHCSAALCREHALEAPREVTTIVPLGRVVALPISAREFLCRICKQTLEQPRRVA